MATILIAVFSGGFISVEHILKTNLKCLMHRWIMKMYCEVWVMIIQILCTWDTIKKKKKRQKS